MKKCNFDLWKNYKSNWYPEVNFTCSRNWYYANGELKNYYYPFCVQEDDGSYYGKWDSCNGWFDITLIKFIKI